MKEKRKNNVCNSEQWEAKTEASGAKYQAPKQLLILKIEIYKINCYNYLKSKYLGPTIKNEFYITLAQ